MNIGTVKWFCLEKGYGFIESEEPPLKGDVFVHLTAVERSGYEGLEKGQRVEFLLSDDLRKGKSTAINITIIQQVPN